MQTTSQKCITTCWPGNPGGPGKPYKDKITDTPGLLKTWFKEPELKYQENVADIRSLFKTKAVGCTKLSHLISLCSHGSCYSHFSFGTLHIQTSLHGWSLNKIYSICLSVYITLFRRDKQLCFIMQVGRVFSYSLAMWSLMPWKSWWALKVQT